MVERQNGDPAVGVPVNVVGIDHPGFAGILFALFSLGLGCLADSSVCTGSQYDVADTTTDAGGRYRGVLPRSYVPGTETDTDWVVTATLPASEGELVGPSSSSSSR
ncbi:MAG: hypothetical protein ABR540_11980 [Acidimicrobiales bacterium]